MRIRINLGDDPSDWLSLSPSSQYIDWQLDEWSPDQKIYSPDVSSLIASVTWPDTGEKHAIFIISYVGGPGVRYTKPSVSAELKTYVYNPTSKYDPNPTPQMLGCYRCCPDELTPCPTSASRNGPGLSPGEEQIRARTLYS